MENLTQEFSDLVGLRKDSWECRTGFISLKQSLNPQGIKAGFLYIVSNCAK